jgi:hypothetical protein
MLGGARSFSFGSDDRMLGGARSFSIGSDDRMLGGSRIRRSRGGQMNYKKWDAFVDSDDEDLEERREPIARPTQGRAPHSEVVMCFSLHERDVILSVS